jgi:hypothetical protein
MHVLGLSGCGCVLGWLGMLLGTSFSLGLETNEMSWAVCCTGATILFSTVRTYACGPLLTSSMEYLSRGILLGLFYFVAYRPNVTSSSSLTCS